MFLYEPTSTYNLSTNHRRGELYNRIAPTGSYRRAAAEEATPTDITNTLLITDCLSHKIETTKALHNTSSHFVGAS